MDDLLTIRENEVDDLKTIVTKKSKKQRELQEKLVELEKSFKSLE
jgi:hypothetical protein